jgi:hypothetical protein
LLLQGLLIGLLLLFGIFLELPIYFAPIPRVPRLMWLLFPVWNIALDKPEPYLACFSE